MNLWDGLLGHKSRRLSCLWLVTASLFFYGWWNASFVVLLIASVQLLDRLPNKPGDSKGQSQLRTRAADIRSCGRSSAARLFQIRLLFRGDSNRIIQLNTELRPYHSASRNFILYLHADRISGRYLSGKGERI